MLVFFFALHRQQDCTDGAVKAIGVVWAGDFVRKRWS
jgi:hypothetical protein